VGASAGNKSEFVDTFDKVIAAMDSDDKSELSKLLGDLDDELGNLLRVRAGLGARMNRVELAAGRLEDDNVNFTKLMSKNEDVDIAEAIMKLQNEENVYRASLATGARVIQPSLVDFLK
jgi:flagellar hook-associated protein 3 FlgL